MNKYKTFNELKQELGNDYERFLYRCNVELLEEKENLIKYLEDEIKECQNDIEMLEGTGSHRVPLLANRIYTYEDILEKVRSDEYE